MNTQIENLKAALPMVPDRQKDFAGSLIHQFERKGDLSDKQWYWVQKLADDAECAGVPDFTKEPEVVGQMHGLIELFETAKEHLKYPAISLQLDDGSPLKVYISGSKSKTPGFVQVTDGGPFGNNVWYGRVSPEGVWEKSKAAEADQVMARKVQTLLKSMSVDPAGTASAYGKLTGHCCFCRKKLEDEKSTAVGYGPVCAKNYGLPWGKKASTFACN